MWSWNAIACWTTSVPLWLPSGFCLVLRSSFKLMYAGNKDECYVDSRIRMYERQKVKLGNNSRPEHYNPTFKTKLFPGLHMASIIQCTQHMIDYPPLKRKFEERRGTWSNNQPDTVSCDEGSSEVRYGITAQVEKSKKITVVNFM